MKVGKYTYGHETIKVVWDTLGEVTIGKFCSIADNVTIFLGGSHRIDYITTYPFGVKYGNIFSNKAHSTGTPLIRKRDVTIGNDVWIASNVTIMEGVTIGDGAVIGRNSHVVEDVKPYSVVGGNPAQFYYFRFTKEKIEKLLEIRWWDCDDAIINSILPVLTSSDIDSLYAWYLTTKQ